MEKCDPDNRDGEGKEGGGRVSRRDRGAKLLAGTHKTEPLLSGVQVAQYGSSGVPATERAYTTLRASVTTPISAMIIRRTKPRQW